MLAFTSSLEGTLVLKKAVDYETLKHFKIAIRAQVLFSTNLFFFPFFCYGNVCNLQNVVNFSRLICILKSRWWEMLMFKKIYRIRDNLLCTRTLSSASKSTIQTTRTHYLASHVTGLIYPSRPARYYTTLLY